MRHLISRVSGGSNSGAVHLAAVNSTGLAYCYGKPCLTQQVASSGVARHTYNQLETQLRSSMQVWTAFRWAIEEAISQGGFYGKFTSFG